ncbi:hypothetical protein Hokovirus_1_251 [Hokovirus HKV1]|uniref:Uncharacterized protein n=1 Tax=Hokovirus HKV1 TaxID=1977638 RepID=A0A1V0SF74_9VIRU|nr:hypothetical protein Hokovirus_1_251 [Hokovirus HKV1]
MEFKVLTLKCEKVGNKLCLYDLKNKEHNFAEISDSYDMLFLVCFDDYENFINRNYELVLRGCNIQLYRNTEFTLYNFGMIKKLYDHDTIMANFYPGSSVPTQIIKTDENLEKFRFHICECENGVRIEYPLEECFGDNFLTLMIDNINKSLPVIVIYFDDLMQNKFLCSLFNITKTNINYAVISGYLIEKKKL